MFCRQGFIRRPPKASLRPLVLPPRLVYTLGYDGRVTVGQIRTKRGQPMALLDNRDKDDKNKAKSIMEKRRDKIIKTMDEPVLPKFCHVSFWCMVVCTAVVIITDIVTYFRFGVRHGLAHLLGNASFSAFFTWLVFALFLLPCCAWQITRLRRDPEGKNTPAKSKTVSDENKPAKTLKQREMPYRVFFTVTAAGLVVFGLLFLIFS